MSAQKRKFTSGYCARLELENFKSWKGKQSVGPFTNGFTAIVGSNGAGKSNLMDAISFVTGVKAKKLRGDQLKDLIYDGDKQAEQENRHMKVTMVYSCGKNEVHGMREGAEIVFTRTVTYSVPGSLFQIGNRRVTFEEYNDMLSKLNILVEARNFLIFQGDVEATASKSPQDLSLFFEQVSGSEVYREEYEKCFAKKEELEAIAAEKFTQARTAKAERKEAKEQKEEMDRYKELVQEREDLRVEFALFQIQEADKSLADSKAQLEEAKVAVQEAEKVEKAMEQERKQAQTELAKKNRQLSKVEEASQAAAKRFNSLNTAFVKKSEAGKRETSKRKDAEAALKSAKETLEKHKQEIANVQKLIGEFEGKEKVLVAALKGADEEEEEKTELTKEQRAQLEKLRLEADKSNADLRAEEVRLARELDVCKDRLHVAKSNREQLESRLKEVQAEKAELERRKQRSEQHVESLQGKVAEYERAVKERNAQMKKLSDDVEAKKGQLEQAKQTLNMSKARSAETRRSKKLEETVAALKRNFEGVKGRLVELVRPTNAKFALAVDTALGKHMDSIVVTHEAVAFECMKYLRDQRLGTATFLPLDTIQPKPISENKRREVGKDRPYRFCYDLLDFQDPSLEPAVRFAAGDSMICDTLEDARTLCFKKNIRVKAVTIEGHLISPRGEMTGGATGDQGRVDRFAESALAKTREEKEQLEKEIAEMERKLDHLRAQAANPDAEQSGAQSRLKFASQDLASCKTKLEEIETRLKKASAAHDESKAKLDELESEIASLSSQLEKVRESIAKKEEQLFKTVSGIKGNVREVERREAELKASKRAELTEIRAQLSKLTSSLKYLESQNRSQAVQDCESTLKERQEQIARLEEELKSMKAELEEADQAQKEADQVRAKAAQEVDVAQAKVNECQRRLEAASKEKGAATKKVAQSESDYQKARTTKAEIIRQASLDGVVLPKKKKKAKGEADAEEEEESMDIVAGEEEDASALLKKAADAAFDMSVLKSRTCANASEYVQKLEELKQEAESLAPNTRADVRLQEASEKLKDTDASVAEAREAADEASKAFEKVRKERAETFISMFKHVADRIDGIYRALTKRPSAPLGGSAFLAVMDEENPFSGGIKFECKPPNKRFRAMEQLSGGEKTIAALALLFAIHSYRPSPFFVLDEVDAALDNDNVERVSNYISMRSSLTQHEEEEEGGEGEEQARDGDNDEEEGVKTRKRSKIDQRRFQSLVISLKDSFFSKAEALVGVYKDNVEESSKCLTLDLSQYGN